MQSFACLKTFTLLFFVFSNYKSEDEVIQKVRPEICILDRILQTILGEI